MKYFSEIIWQVVFVALLTVFSYSSLADQQWNQDSSTAWRGTSSWKDKAEKIKVTGSHIKRLQQEGPTPLLVIDREQIDHSGRTSITDLFWELPAATGGVLRGHVGGEYSHAGKISLRGMGNDEY